MTTTALWLLVAFQLKHFLADYPLQGWPYAQFMLGKFRDTAWPLNRGWILPLLAHAGVHAVLTAALCAAVGRPELMWLGLLDLAVHFTMDRVKAGPRLLGRWKPIHPRNVDVALPWQWAENAFFWWSLGFDQMVHHLTDLYVAWRLLT